MKARWGAVAAAVVLLAGCSGGNELHDVDAERLADWQEAVGDEPSEWPLTVAEGQIDCLGGGMLGLQVDGTLYALNGLAQGEAADIEPIWLDRTDVDGLKVDIGDLIAYANVTCGY